MRNRNIIIKEYYNIIIFLISIIAISIFFINSIYASPVYFFGIDAASKEKFSACIPKEIPEKFLLKPEYFDSEKYGVLDREQIKFSKIYSKKRHEQILCLRNLKYTTEEKNSLINAFDNYLAYQMELVEIHNRWFYGISKINIYLNKNESKITEFHSYRIDIYRALNIRTKDAVLKDSLSEKESIELENELYSIYLSLFKAQFDFYLGITPEFRNEIFKEISKKE